MAAGATAEQAVRHIRNLEEDVDVDEHEKDEQRQALDNKRRVGDALAERNVVVG